MEFIKGQWGLQSCDRQQVGSCHANSWTALRHRLPLCMVVVVLPLVVDAAWFAGHGGHCSGSTCWTSTGAGEAHITASWLSVMGVVTNPLDMPRKLGMRAPPNACAWDQ